MKLYVFLVGGTQMGGGPTIIVVLSTRKDS